MIAPPRVVGRRGVALSFFAMLDFVYALSLWRPAPEVARSPSIRFLADVMPLSAWATLWFVVGVVCAIGAFAHSFDPLAFTAAAGIKTLWGGIYLFGWMWAGLDRGWVAGAVWIAFAAFVVVLAGWPEPGAAIVDSHTDEYDDGSYPADES